MKERVEGNIEAAAATAWMYTNLWLIVNDVNMGTAFLFISR